MAKKTIKPAVLEIAQSDKEIVRVAFRLHGPELQQIREVREMLSLNSELDAARYLMQRGLESISATLANRRLMAKMASEVTGENIVAHMMNHPALKAEIEKDGKESVR